MTTERKTSLMRIVRYIEKHAANYEEAYEMLRPILKKVGRYCSKYFQGCTCEKCTEREFIEIALFGFFMQDCFQTMQREVV